MNGAHRSQNSGSLPQAGASASTSDRKLSIELPSSRQIYTIGSAVSGLVHLGTKERGAIQEVHVSLVCIVHSIYYQSYGGSMQDIRRETSKLLHLDETLWSRADGDTRDPPATFSFHFTIPQFGNDDNVKNPRAPLPPSFYPESNTLFKMIGYIMYYIKVSVARKGFFNRKERAFCPIVFLPPSPPPPLLPTLPEDISVKDLDHLDDSQWSQKTVKSNLHSSIFSSYGNGKATLTLWLPQVPRFPRLMSIPFILQLTLQTQYVKDNAGEEPPKAILPPPPHLDKASLYLMRSIWTHADGATDDHARLLAKDATDNFLHGITPQEGAWLKKADFACYWEKAYMWRGSWTFKEVPNFSNRQLTWKYALVAQTPIKGPRNSAKLVSGVLDVSSGIAAGTNVIPASEADMMELPPDYFNTEGYDDLDDKKA